MSGVSVMRLSDAMSALFEAAQDVYESRNNYPTDLGNRADERVRDEEFERLGRTLEDMESGLPRPEVRAWLQREGRPTHEMTKGFRVDDDGRVLFPLALDGDQAILTVQLAACLYLRSDEVDALVNALGALLVAEIPHPEDTEAQSERCSLGAVLRKLGPEGAK